MAELLVTGSRGLIGNSLVRHLTLSGHVVRGFDWCLPHDHPGHGDIRDAAKLDAAMRDVDGVIHLAAVSRVGWGQRDPGLCMSVNVQGTACVFDAVMRLQGRPWVIVASSREVYGEPDRLPVKESDDRQPCNTYGQSKLKTEKLTEDAAYDGIKTSILRFANVYGDTNDHWDRVVPSFVRNAVAGQPLHVHGADSCFDFTHVVDVAKGIERAVHAMQDGESLPTMHFATGTGTRLGELARLVNNAAGGRSAIIETPGRDGFVSRFVGDPGLMERVLGVRCEIDLASGLRQMVWDFREPANRDHMLFPERHAVPAE